MADRGHVIAAATRAVVNAVWCLFLNIKNRTIGDYVKRSAPILPNVLFAAVAGLLWCSEFICFKMGEPMMGSTSFIGWAALTGSLIFFSQGLGIVLGEWKGTSRRTVRRLGTGLALLAVSACLAGYGPTLG